MHVKLQKNTSTWMETSCFKIDVKLMPTFMKSVSSFMRSKVPTVSLLGIGLYEKKAVKETFMLFKMMFL